MVKIEVNGKFLKLYPNQLIRLKMRNPIMYEDVLPKYYSLPFTIPLGDGVNSFILKYPQEWKNQYKLINKIDCLVYLFGDTNPRRSTLNINTVSEDAAECNIIVDRNADDLGDTKLRDVDMGTLLLEDKSICRKSIRIDTRSSFSTTGNFELTISGHLFTVPKSLWAADGIAVINSFASQINAANIGITASLQQNNIDMGGPGHGHDLNYYLDLKATKVGTDGIFTLDGLNDQITTLDYYWNFALNGSIMGATNVAAEYDWISDHVTYSMIEYKKIIENYNADTSPVTFPLVENVNFIDDAINYNGFQNSDLFTVSADWNKISFITPMPHLVYVLKKIFKYLGFDAYGMFLYDNYIKRFILYSNVAADCHVQVYGVANPSDSYNSYLHHGNLVNIHSSVIKIANHCPDMTVKEFLTEIRKLFNLKFNYDFVKKTVEIDFIRTSIPNIVQISKDFTPNIVNRWQLKNNGSDADDIKLFSFDEDSEDEKSKQLGVLDYQKPLIINPDGKKEIKPKVSSISEEIVGGFSTVAVVQIPGVYNKQGTACKLKLLQYFHTPTVPTGKTIPNWAKIPYYSTFILLPYAFNKDQYYMFDYISNWSLRWDTAKGLYSKCWKNKVDILRNGVQLKIAMTFNAAELQNMENTPYHNLNGSLAIWQDIDVQLGDDTIPPAECIYQII